MDWLTAILAFATTMLMLSMIVTTLVETVHRIFGLRARGLWKMLGVFYDEVVKSRLPSEDTDVLTRQAFQSAMARNVIANTAVEDANGMVSLDPPSILGRTFAPRNPSEFLTNLPLEMFLERLGASKFNEITKVAPANSDDAEQVAVAAAQSENLLKDIAQKFENYGFNSSARFEQRARSLSIAFAFIISFSFYVQPHNLITTYLKNPTVAQNVALESDKLLDKMEDRTWSSLHHAPHTQITTEALLTIKLLGCFCSALCILGV